MLAWNSCRDCTGSLPSRFAERMPSTVAFAAAMVVIYGIRLLNGSLTNVAVVGCTLLAAGSIDNQLDLVIRDLIQDVRTSLVELAYLQGRNTGLFDQVTGSAGCHNFKATADRSLLQRQLPLPYLCH